MKRAALCRGGGGGLIDSGGRAVRRADGQESGFSLVVTPSRLGIAGNATVFRSSESRPPPLPGSGLFKLAVSSVAAGRTFEQPVDPDYRCQTHKQSFVDLTASGMMFAPRPRRGAERAAEIVWHLLQRGESARRLAARCWPSDDSRRGNSSRVSDALCGNAVGADPRSSATLP